MLSVDHCVLIEVKRCEWIEIEQTEPVIFTTVIKALMTKHLLLITQQAPDQDPIDPTVAPSLLYNYQGRWFHRAWCTLRRGYLLFHLARISSTVLTEPCPIQTFHTDNLDESIDILKSAPRYRAVIDFTATTAEFIKHQVWHWNQLIEARDDGVILRLPAAHDRELMMKVMQCGSQAQVLEPPHLAAYIRDEALRMIRE
jgi:predicted DNA-binding transcriptional regulator YafY